jgi:hypothetical protein
MMVEDDVTRLVFATLHAASGRIPALQALEPQPGCNRK